MGNLKDAFDAALYEYAKFNGHIPSTAVRAEYGETFQRASGYCETCYFEYEGFEIIWYDADGNRFVAERLYDNPMDYMQEILAWEDSRDVQD